MHGSTGIVLRAAFAYVALVTGGRWSRARTAGRLLAASGLLALWCEAGHALAQAPQAKVAEPFRLVWSSSAGCGNARTFLEQLASRTTRLREAREGEHAITLIVETFRNPGGVRGQLTVRKRDGDLTVREVPGLNCLEAESGMALIAALMVDPLAGTAERALPGALVEPAADASDAGPRSPSHREADWSWRVEQRLTARTAVAPGWAWGQALGVMLTRESATFRPSLAVSAHDARATIARPSGSAELRWSAAQMAVCPVGLRPDASWDLRACASFQLGRLRGEGFQTAKPTEASILWASAGLELQGRYQVVGPLWVGLEGAFTFPFTRERFYLEPQQTLHQVPSWGASLGGGAGLRFF